MRKLTILLIAVLVSIGIMPAFAQTPEATPAATSTVDPASAGHFRVINFAADVPSIDVWIDGNEALIASLEAEKSSQWVNVAPGAHTLAIGPNGSTSDQAVIPSESVSIPGGMWTTIVVLGAKSDSSLRTATFQQDMTELTPGVTRVTFLNAVNAEPVTLLRDGIPYVTSLDFPKAYAVDEDWGSHTFEAQTGGDKPQSLASLKADLREATYYIVALTINGTDQKIVVLPTTSADIAIALGKLKTPGTLLDAIESTDLTGDFSAAIEKAGMADQFSAGGPYTLFVPNGFKLDSSMDQAALAALLKDHLVQGDLMSQELIKAGTVTALSGKSYPVHVEGNTIMVGNSRVVAVNMPASNGVIHIIDKPLS